MPVKNRLNRKHCTSACGTLVRQDSTSSTEDNVDPRYASGKEYHNAGSKRQLRHYHHNACRTKVHLLLDRKAEQNPAAPQKRKRRVSYFLMSEQYKRKMSDALQIPEEQVTTKRKISWSEESEFVTFNKNKSCQAIKQAPRHKFSIDE